MGTVCATFVFLGRRRALLYLRANITICFDQSKIPASTNQNIMYYPMKRVVHVVRDCAGEKAEDQSYRDMQEPGY